MILAAFYIVGVGLCAAADTKPRSDIIQIPIPSANKSQAYYRGAMAVLKNPANLHLKWFSSDLKESLANCLVSEFKSVQGEDYHRTLGPNFKSKETEEEQNPLQQARPEVTITVHSQPSSWPYITVSGPIEEHWTDPKDILFANPNCILLEARLRPRRNVSCVVFAPRPKGQKCVSMAQKYCSTGQNVDFSQCEPDSKAKPNIPKKK
uniref:Putative secreted protein n=1 Tax=Amblyomma parvum TaxID=251391 RepID=A0A023FSN5_AMBPA